VSIDSPQAEPRPFRPGLLQLEPFRLVGSTCTHCKASVFPARSFCPNCRAVDSVESTTLQPQGVIHSFTIVRQAPEGVATPYVLAQIDLLDDQVRLMSQVVGVQVERVRIGQPVVVEQASFGDSADFIGYRFRIEPTSDASPEPDATDARSERAL